MKNKTLFVIILLLISQSLFASYSNTDSLKAIILSKKSNPQNMKRIEVGEEIYIIRKGDMQKITGKVNNITDNSLVINNSEYNFSNIQAIGASRKYNGYVTAVISGVSFSLLFIAYIISIIAYAYYMNIVLNSIAQPSNSESFLFVFSTLSMIFTGIFSSITGEVFYISGIYYLYNKYSKKRYFLSDWRIETVKGDKKQTDWKRLKNFIGLK